MPFIMEKRDHYRIGIISGRDFSEFHVGRPCVKYESQFSKFFFFFFHPSLFQSRLSSIHFNAISPSFFQFFDADEKADGKLSLGFFDNILSF